MNSYPFLGIFELIKYKFQNAAPLKSSTIKLLNSSVLVAFSGMLRVYLASLLLQTHVNVATCIAGGLIIYSVYTLDRSLDSKEDLINRSELNNSCKEIGLAVSLITFLIGAFVFAQDGILSLAFLPFVTGFLYSKGLKIGKYNLKLKGGLGIKNIVVGITWGVFIALVAGQAGTSIYPLMMVFVLYGVKTFVNSTIDDFKDIKGDTLAGLKTLPICLGEKRTRTILLVLHVVSHLVILSTLYYGILAFEPVILAGSFLCGLICILQYTNEERYISGKNGLFVFKYGESALITILIMH